MGENLVIEKTFHISLAEKNVVLRDFMPNETVDLLDQWYFVRVPPDVMSHQLGTPKVVGV
jgi:hypothetical protein